MHLGRAPDDVPVCEMAKGTLRRNNLLPNGISVHSVLYNIFSCTFF